MAPCSVLLSLGSSVCEDLKQNGLSNSSRYYRPGAVMSAEALGRDLLGEVKVEGLDEVWSDP